MKQPQPGSFPTDVEQKLKTYVYRLIDPRNGETLYKAVLEDFVGSQAN